MCSRLQQHIHTNTHAHEISQGMGCSSNKEMMIKGAWEKSLTSESVEQKQPLKQQTHHIYGAAVMISVY